MGAYYGDDAQRINNEVGAAFAHAHGGEYHPFAEFDTYDGWIERDRRLAAFVEVKCRDRTFNAYPDVWLDFGKYSPGRRYATAWRRPWLFVVRFADGLAYCDLAALDPETLTVDIGERQDRDDPLDRDLVVCVPMTAFRRVET